MNVIQYTFSAVATAIVQHKALATISCAACVFAVWLLRKRRRLHRLERFDEIDVERYQISLVSSLMERAPYIVKWAFARAFWLPTIMFNLLLWKVAPEQYCWWNRIDEYVILGALPFFTTVPDLYSEGVRGVINLCEEYSGPIATYAKHNIRQLHIPTVDYTSPTVEQIEKALNFIEEHMKKGETVFVHCKAGKGRSTTVVLAYLMKLRGLSKMDAMKFCIVRRPQVSRYVWRRKVIAEIERKYDIPKETPPNSPLLQYIRTHPISVNNGNNAELTVL